MITRAPRALRKRSACKRLYKILNSMRIKYRCRKRMLILSLLVIFIFILLYFFWSFHSSLETEITNPDSHLNHSPQTSFFDLSFLPTDPKKLNRRPHICPEPNPELELDLDFCMPHFIIFGGKQSYHRKFRCVRIFYALNNSHFQSSQKKKRGFTPLL